MSKHCKYCKEEPCGSNCEANCKSLKHSQPVFNGSDMCKDCYYSEQSYHASKQYITSIDRALGYCDE